MSQKKQKIISIIIFILLILGIPFILKFGVQQQQNTQQKASTTVWNGGKDTCGHVQVSFEQEIPQCPNETLVTNSYQTIVRLKSADGGTYTVNPLFESFWCKSSADLGDGVNPTSCIKNVLVNKTPVKVGPGSGTLVSSVVQKASLYGYSACGIYQTDFSFTIAGTTCRFGYSALDPSPSHPVLAAGYCNTNTACTVTVPTPTPLLTPTPTPTITDTPTPTPTPTPGLTDTPTPTPTPTPGLTDTPTPTPTPLVPTPTITPRPTLPPTGPGDTIVGIGLAGVAAAAIGGLLLFGL